jgi:spore maturation protein SpmB
MNYIKRSHNSFSCIPPDYTRGWMSFAVESDQSGYLIALIVLPYVVLLCVTWNIRRAGSDMLICVTHRLKHF